jgi:hypothetical protein
MGRGFGNPNGVEQMQRTTLRAEVAASDGLHIIDGLNIDTARAVFMVLANPDGHREMAVVLMVMGIFVPVEGVLSFMLTQGDDIVGGGYRIDNGNMVLAASKSLFPTLES